MDHFSIGLIVGVFVGAPIFYSGESAIAVVLQVGIAFATAILTGSFVSIGVLFQKTIEGAATDPSLVVGLVVGFVLVGIASSIVRKRERSKLDGKRRIQSDQKRKGREDTEN